MTKLYLGLIQGRHTLPCNDFVLGEVQDVLDFNGIYAQIGDKLSPIIEPTYEWSTDWNDNPIQRSTIELNVYVTGLTAATVELIKWCEDHHVSLVLWHYDRESDDYKRQSVVCY